MKYSAHALSEASAYSCVHEFDSWHLPELALNS